MVGAARRLAKRAFRQAERRFLAEGPQAVAEALAEPGSVGEIFVLSDATGRVADLAASAAAAGIVVHRVSGAVLEALAQTMTPQGIVAIARFRDVSLTEALEARPALVAVLAAVRDPGNAGTVLRAADAAGAESVVFTAASVDPYNGKCVRASAGSLFHIPFTVGVELAETVAGLRASGLRVLAAAGTGQVELDELEDRGGLAGPTAWLFGNEAWGLRDEALALADEIVRVPIHGRAESLNLATAATVCLYASARAQRRPGGCRVGG